MSEDSNTIFADSDVQKPASIKNNHKVQVTDESTRDITLTEVNLNLVLLPKINFALQQNSIAIIRSLKIENLTERPLNRVTIQISSLPTFSVTKELRIDKILPLSTYSFDTIPLELDYQYLAELSERVNGNLLLTVIETDQNDKGRILIEEEFRVEVCAFDDWMGSDVMPQLLAAFVTPNLDLISTIQKRMTLLLKEKNLDTSLEGYQSKSKKRCLEIIEAAYNAVQENNINYANPPASFECCGQRIRFIDKIFNDKLATCLDLSLLFASILEQCGLNPLILLQKGHAYVGCHLVDESFHDSFFDDLQAIRKRAQLDELIVFESTGVAMRTNRLPFLQAENAAGKHLEKDNEFIGALDVRQARIEKIRPVPLRRSADGFILNVAKTEMTDVLSHLPLQGSRDLITPLESEESETPQTRLQKWQQKLLDLSKRNKLLNFKTKGVAVQIAFTDLPVLEDKLASGAVFQIKPSVPLIDGTDIRDLSQLELQTGGNPVTQYLRDEFGHKRLRSYLSETELHPKLLKLFRQAKNDLEESGVGTLYLALGFLEWTDDSRDNTTYRAPILLLPMKLDRRSVREAFSLERVDEETVINVTLLEMMGRDFGKTIPGISLGELPTDDAGIDVNAVFQLFQQAIKDLPGWEVRKEAWLSCFSFKKFVMWNDLRNRTDDLMKSEVVNHLMNHPQERFHDGIGAVTPAQLDESFHYDQIFCPLSTDSSQMSAVLSAAKGKTFVLYGPPGTGKSQSITNMIAHCLATGKKVLFVAEKRAALEVVYKRLSEVGLAPFCLELHSHKVGKNEVMEQFRQVLDYRERQIPTDWSLLTKKLENAKKQLNAYVSALHERYPSEFTPYHVFSYLIQHESDTEELESIGGIPFEVASRSKEELDDIIAIGREIALYEQALPKSAWRMFRLIQQEEWSLKWAKESTVIATKLSKHSVALKRASHTLFPQLGIKQECQEELGLYEVVDLANILNKAFPLPEIFYGADWLEFNEQLAFFKQLAQRNEQNIARLKSIEFVQLFNLCRDNTSVRLSRADGNLFQFNAVAAFSHTTNNLPAWTIEAKQKLTRYCEAINALFTHIQQVFHDWNYKVATFTERDAFHLQTIINLIMSSTETPPAEFIGKEWNLFAAETKGLIEAGQARDHVRNLLVDFDLDAVLLFDIEVLSEKIENCNVGFSLLKGIRRVFIISKFKKCLLNSKKRISYKMIPDYLEHFKVYQTSQQKLDLITLDCSKRLTNIWNKGNADWDELNLLLHFGDHLERAICDFSEDDVSRAQLRKGIGEYLLAHQKIFVSNHFLHIHEVLQEYANATDDFLAIFIQDHGQSPHTVGNTLLDELRDADSSIRKCGNIDITKFVSYVANFIFSHSEITSFGQANNLSGRIPFAWENGRCDQKKLQEAIDYGNHLDSRVQNIHFLSSDKLASMRNCLGLILGQSSVVLCKDGVLRGEINDLIEAWSLFSESLPDFIEYLSVAPEFRNDQNNHFLDDCYELAQAVIAYNNDLRNWCLWRKTRSKALAAHLEFLVTAVESLELPLEKINYVIEKRLKEKFAEEVIEKVSILRDFMGSQQNDLILNFQKWDDEYTNLTKLLVVAKVSSALPGTVARQSEPKSGTELGTLQREVLRQRGHKPVRKLLEEIPNILSSLKPCMLMSPLSVAQYLPPTQELFDIVIFDEASQIPPWDAIGAIARGKQLIVCGDPKQLPPTDFFQKQTDNDDEFDDDSTILDEKSILDECLAAGFDQVLLNWHYRSRHESLIAFSNHHYYDNRLLTFPHASEAKHLGLYFHYVKDGVYDRKKSCTNKQEARELVSEVVKRLRLPEFTGKSLGIVTFSMRQQTLIEDLLEEERRKYPEIERFFQSDYPEPVFVKNLENVQGDERDVMFFSICYGPDEAGNRYMNFGPLSRDGGERRLNVAITRAKESTVVFSSIRADFIDRARVSKKGPLHLRDFLDYAERDHKERGKALSGEISGVSLFDYDSVFEEEVADFLREHGYGVHTQVGCSGYRIDLAITDLENPGRYILGVECDGATYHSSATARDRDKLRQSVLENMGWRITRVWSTEWWFNRGSTAETLLKKVEEAMHVTPLEKELPQEQPVHPEERKEKESDADSTELQEDLECEFKLDYPRLDDYQNHPEFCRNYNSDDFYEPSSGSIIQRQIEIIIAMESPVLQSVLLQRISSAWGFMRTGRRIGEVLVSFYPKKYTVSNGERVFWSNETTPETYQYFRVSAGSYSRKIEEIPVQEIRNAMKWLLLEYHAFDDPDALFKETGRIFGFLRLTESSKKYYKAALKLLKTEGVVG